MHLKMSMAIVVMVNVAADMADTGAIIEGMKTTGVAVCMVTGAVEASKVI